MKHVLLTDATGRLGTFFFEYIRDKHRFHLADPGNHETLRLGVVNLHDGLGPVLASVALQADTACDMTDGDPAGCA